MDCSVCCEKINLQNHKKVACPFCDFSICRKCVQIFLLSLTNDPHCMNCNNLWSRDVIDQACTKVFRNTQLKTHRETILFEREKCLLPQTQDAVSNILQGRKITSLITDAEQEITKIRTNIRNLERTRERILHGHGEISNDKREFVRKCPVEKCRGFLSTRWKCQICENNICPDCNEIKNENHECDPDNVATVALLKKDTKPCPRCGTMIFKISGCSQMWCPDCHVAFDWNTMRIETGRIHNPHYYDFQRIGGKIQRERGDVLCGGMPPLKAVHNIVRNSPNESTIIFKIHRLTLHIENWCMQEVVDDVDNQKLRVRYLLNEISENEMKIILQKNEKLREKRRDNNNLLQMFRDVMTDLFRQLIAKTITPTEFYNSSCQLRNYTRTVFESLHKRYTCSTWWISDSWECVSWNHKRIKNHDKVVVVVV